MPSRAVVVVGASAGGVEPMAELIGSMPADLAAAVLVVLHMPPGADSHLPEILERAGPLQARHAENGEPLENGHVYVSPPDVHLTIEEGHVRTDRGPRQNHHRPAIDPLLRSASRWRDGRTIAVILSGVQHDGLSGAIAVCRNGGAVIAQDPGEAMFPSMPAAVLAGVPGSLAMPVSEMAPRIVALIADRLGPSTNGNPAPERPTRPPSREVAAVGRPREIPSEDEVPVADGPVRYGCPDCGGVLTEIAENGHLRFRCRVGHEYAADDLLLAQDVALENALWSALRGMEERAELSQRLSDRIASTSPGTAARHRARAAETNAEADLIRDFLLRRPSTEEAEPS